MALPWPYPHPLLCQPMPANNGSAGQPMAMKCHWAEGIAPCHLVMAPCTINHAQPAGRKGRHGWANSKWARAGGSVGAGGLLHQTRQLHEGRLCWLRW